MHQSHSGAHPQWYTEGIRHTSLTFALMQMDQRCSAPEVRIAVCLCGQCRRFESPLPDIWRKRIIVILVIWLPYSYSYSYHKKKQIFFIKKIFFNSLLYNLYELPGYPKRACSRCSHDIPHATCGRKGNSGDSFRRNYSDFEQPTRAIELESRA